MCEPRGASSQDRSGRHPELGVPEGGRCISMGGCLPRSVFMAAQAEVCTVLPAYWVSAVLVGVAAALTCWELAGGTWTSSELTGCAQGVLWVCGLLG